MKEGLLLVILLLLLPLTSCRAAPNTIAARIERVESELVPITAQGLPDMEHRATLASRMEHYGVPGLSVAVINDFQVEWAKGYGVLEAGSQAPVTAGTLFHAGSIAKPVSAAAALVLVERGLLDLDEDVNAKLVSWQIPENEYTVDEKVTLRRLLSHSSGLTDGFPMRSSSDPEYAWGRAGEGETPSATIQQMLEAQPPADEGAPTRVTQLPGTTYAYSNLGYGVVQLLMTDVTGQPFAALMQETVLNPLGMTSSTFAQPLPETLRQQAVTEHYVSGQPFAAKRHHFPLQAAGGLWTTPSDLARFAIEIARARDGASARLLPPAMVAEMLSGQIEVSDSFLKDAYGLGFDLAETGKEFHFMHTGGTWGSTALLWMYPETGQGAIIMTNSAAGDGAIRLELLLSIADVYNWSLELLPVGDIDLAVVFVANLTSLLFAAAYLAQPPGRRRIARIAGLMALVLALPLGAAVVLNALLSRGWWFILLPVPMILHDIVTFLLEIVPRHDLHAMRLQAPYLALLYLALLGLSGYAVLALPVYGAITLTASFICAGATRYARTQATGVGEQRRVPRDEPGLKGGTA